VNKDLEQSHTSLRYSRKSQKIHVGSETESGSETNLNVGSGSEKNHSGSTTTKVPLELADFYSGFQIVAEFRSFLAPTLLVSLVQSQTTGAKGTKTVHNDHCSERKR
jgi:hypothetical protein